MVRFLFLAITLLVPVSVQATTVKSALPGAELRGVATFRYVGFPLYEARLFTKSGAPLDWSKDFGLELKYLRNLSEYDLVESTMRELKRTGVALPLRRQLKQCYNDVRKGDRYVAVSKGQNQIEFWHNGERVCMLRHPQIKTRFMAVFLGENTRSKSFTRKLKGE